MPPSETSEPTPGSRGHPTDATSVDAVSRIGLAVLAAQHFLILRRTRPGVLVLVPPLPDWLEGWGPIGEGPGRGFPVADRFPYLESCLPEAEAYWNGETEHPPGFHLWSEPRPDGVDLHLHAAAMRTDAGGFLVIRRADSEFEARRQVLQLARERALDHERLLEETSAKEVLLHCIVHDLAGPLSGIQGCLEMLAAGKLEPSDAEFVRMGLLQAGRQQRLIRNILDVFAHGDYPGRSRGSELADPLDPLACVEQVTEGLRPAFLAKKVRLELRVPAEMDGSIRVVAETSRLERVLHNLLENALRYAPVDSAVIVRADDDGDRWGLTVADEGPGVAPEVRPRLFRRFVAGGKAPGKS
ncbi:MAG: HAMP domain-containing histidine kinase, partial [Verrucomicrobiales bacterium]|nr:HAMP domain-containing histidine kinase [Verrucomicrobiales bacterium]